MGLVGRVRIRTPPPWRTGERSARLLIGRTVVDGNNSDAKFWVGGSIDIPFGGKRAD